MIYLRSVLGGLGALVCGLVVLPLFLLLWPFVEVQRSGSGGIGSVSSGLSDGLVLTVMLFGAGFAWQYRRARRGWSFMNRFAALGVVLFFLALVLAMVFYFRPTIEYAILGSKGII